MSLEAIFFDFAARLPSYGSRDGVPVLCYHEVFTDEALAPNRFAISVETLEAHLAATRSSGRKVLALPELGEAREPSALFTFDDNLPSHVSRALPVLKAAGATAVFFLNPEELNSPGRLSHRDVHQLIEAGMFVGAHGHRHRTASSLDPADFRREVQECASFLRSLGMPLTWAYPGGHLGSFDGVHERILRDHGFGLRFSTLEGVCRPADLGRVQGRYVMRRGISARYFEAALSGGLQVVSFAKRLRALARAQPF